ncbi:MAG: penicillin-binding protein 2 [Gemmatimonadales bacterium]
MSPFASWQVARRATQIQWVFIGAFSLLGAAFFKAQVIDHGVYRSESARNRLKPIPLEAPRGYIFDRSGRRIADNVPGYAIKLLASSEDSLRAVLGRLDALITDDTIDADKVVRRWKLAEYEPAMVYASGRYEVVATLEEHRAILPGLVIQQEPRRRYPDSSAVAHLAGYVGEVSATELDNNTFPGAEPGSIVGKQGLELAYDSVLRGRPGVRFVEVTAGGRMVRDQADVVSLPPVAGRNIRTTIDLDLQQFVDSMWRADLPNRRGALVAMTPRGEILAYYSYPTFDPNDFIGRIDPETWNALRSDPNQPLYNRVIQGAYPPGSPFKLAIAAMALRRGLVTMDTRMRVPCTGSYQFGNRIWHCWDPKGHGSLTLRQAIASSCDIYFYQLGQMLGADSILADAAEMGFGDRAGIDIGPESKGALLPSVKAYVNSRGVSTWNNGETLNLAIGQGHHTETLLNMVSFYAALAGDGIKRTPHMIEGTASRVTHDLHLTPEHLADLRAAMVDVVNSGTARGDLANLAGLQQFQIAGKTGSAQVTGEKPLGWFIAFAPADHPRIVVGIAVEEAVHGAVVAKYPARTIMRYLTGRAVKADIGNVTENLAPVPDSAESHPPPQPVIPHRP